MSDTSVESLSVTCVAVLLDGEEIYIPVKEWRELRRAVLVKDSRHRVPPLWTAEQVKRYYGPYTYERLS